ncbi:hypothetical protein SK128_025025 [Halocaridina rubra]|uniref:Secreted protein n=1 Tax=Halocaridina rubra TaxID=373956 RepID=A0AAN8WNN0_HALRR
MKPATLFVVFLCLMGASAQRRRTLESYFDSRKNIEKLIDCFVGVQACTAVEQKIKDQAIATMSNFGQCPVTHCKTQKEREDMQKSMQLLQTKYPDLWNRLVGALILGIDFGRK